MDPVSAFLEKNARDACIGSFACAAVVFLQHKHRFIAFSRPVVYTGASGRNKALQSLRTIERYVVASGGQNHV